MADKISAKIHPTHKYPFEAVFRPRVHCFSSPFSLKYAFREIDSTAIIFATSGWKRFRAVIISTIRAFVVFLLNNVLLRCVAIGIPQINALKQTSLLKFQEPFPFISLSGSLNRPRTDAGYSGNSVDRTLLELKVLFFVKYDDMLLNSVP